MSMPEEQRAREQSGYGAAQEDVSEDTPAQAQPRRLEHERNEGGDASNNELREQHEAEERQSGGGAV